MWDMSSFYDGDSGGGLSVSDAGGDYGFDYGDVAPWSSGELAGDIGGGDFSYGEPAGGLSYGDASDPGGSLSYDAGSGEGGITGVMKGGAGDDIGSLIKEKGLGAESALGGGKSALQKLFNVKTDAQGNADWLDPKNFSKIMQMATGVLSLYGAKKNADKEAAARTAQTAQQLKANSWTPQQEQWANRFLQTPINPNRGTIYASEMRSPIVPSRNYADGGGVRPRGEDLFSYTNRRREQEAGLQGAPETLQVGRTPRSAVPQQSMGDIIQNLPKLFRALGLADDMPQQPMPGQPPRYAEGGDVMAAMMEEEPMSEEVGPGGLSQSEPFVGYVRGEDGGQSDLIEAYLSPGEYVWDAETVSMLGDGNNEAGAAILDEERARIREAKRSAPADDIPPTMAQINGDEPMEGEDELV